MKICKNCRYKGCALCGTDHVIHAADCENYTPASNADRIRAMTDEELAEWIVNDLIEPGYRSADVEYAGWLDWLRQEIRDGKQD